MKNIRLTTEGKWSQKKKHDLSSNLTAREWRMLTDESAVTAKLPTPTLVDIQW